MMLWILAMASAAAEQPVVEVTLVSRMTDIQEYWSVEVPSDGLVLKQELPTARDRRMWEITLTMEMDAPPESIPFQFELAELKYSRRGKLRRRDVITRGEVLANNGGRANFESVVKDHKNQPVEDFELILRPRL